MRKLSLFLSIICPVILTTCKPDVSLKMPPETATEALPGNEPDSPAMIPEEKINPSALSDADKADYAFRLTAAHQKQGRSLVNDTLILFALDYYKKTDSPRLPEAYLLAAAQVDWSDANTDGRIRLLEEALQAADQRSDTAMVRDIGFRLVKLYEAPKNTDQIRKLIAIAEKYAGEKRDLLTYRSMITQFTWENEPDSMLKYAKLAMETAREQNSDLEYALTRYYIEGLNASGRSKEALTVLRDMEGRMEAGSELRFNYISTWIGLGRLDSARAQIDFWQPVMDKYRGDPVAGIEVDVAEVILEMYKNVIRTKEGKPVVLHDIGVPLDRIMSKSRNRIKTDRERQFLQNKLMKDNLMLDIERGRLRQRMLWFGMAASLMIAVLIFFYQRKMLKKERSVRKAKEQLHSHTIRLKENESVIAKNEELIRSLSVQLDGSDELKQEMERLATDNESLKETNKTLREDIEQYSRSMHQKDDELSAYEALIGENARLQERERFLTAQVIAGTDVLDKLSRKARYIDEAQWPEIIHAVNRLFDGFSYRLHTDFPALTEEDIRYCCLIKLRLTVSVISTLTGISPSSVTKRKQRIREKIGQQRRPNEIRKDQSVETYLWNY
jgi:hypothetical protein